MPVLFAPLFHNVSQDLLTNTALSGRVENALISNEFDQRICDVFHQLDDLARAIRLHEMAAIPQALQPGDGPIQDARSLVQQRLGEPRIFVARKALAEMPKDEPGRDRTAFIREAGQLIAQDQEPHPELARPRLGMLSVDVYSVLAAHRQQPL